MNGDLALRALVLGMLCFALGAGYGGCRADRAWVKRWVEAGGPDSATFIEASPEGAHK